jgi:hypothetical protein
MKQKYDDFIVKFEMKSAAVRESANAANARQDARDSGEFVPFDRTKLCNWQDAGKILFACLMSLLGAADIRFIR